MFGLGLVMFVAVKSDVHLDHILFGDMLGIAPEDLLQSGLIALVSTLFLGILRKIFCCMLLIPSMQKPSGCL